MAANGVSKQRAEIAKLEAEAERAKADARLALAKARSETARAKEAEYDAEKSLVALERLREDRNAELVEDGRRHVYRFTVPVSDASVRTCMATLEEWARLEEDEDEKSSFEIVFTSPGGSVLHGFALFDFLRAVSRRGHPVVTVSLGYAASMAGILLQAGDTRRIGTESYLHIHEISTGMVGKVSELEDEVEFCKKMTQRTVDIFVSRSGGKMTAGKLRKMFERRECWLSSDEALRYGLVDEIL